MNSTTKTAIETAYDTARAAWRLACERYTTATKQYRAQLINDSAYLVARAQLKDAEVEFDAAEQAYIAACNALEAAPVAVEPDAQLVLPFAR